MISALGVDYVMVPTGHIPECDYDLESHRRNWLQPRVRPLDLAGVAQSNLHHAQLAIHTGINQTSIRNVLALRPELVLVGRGILDTDNWTMTAERLRRFMPFEGLGTGAAVRLRCAYAAKTYILVLLALRDLRVCKAAF